MVSTWRYHSFKGISLSKPYTPLLIVCCGGLIYAHLELAQPVLLALAAVYVASGIVDPHRRHRSPPPPAAPRATRSGAPVG